MVGRYVLCQLNRVIQNDPNVLVEGPVHLQNSNPLYQSLTNFRKTHSMQISAYLNDYFQSSIERKLKLDERGRHYYASYRGRIVSSVRVTPPPFEVSLLSPELQQAVAEVENFLELGRLLVDDSFRGRGLGKKVLYKAMLADNRANYMGYIAICRDHRETEFSRFGLIPYQDRWFRIPSRENA